MSPFILRAAIAFALVIAGVRVAQEYGRAVALRLDRHVGQRGPGL